MRKITGISNFDGNFFTVFADGKLYTIGHHYTRRLGGDTHEVSGESEAYAEISIGDRLADGTRLTQEVYDRLRERLGKKTRTFVFV